MKTLRSKLAVLALAASVAFVPVPAFADDHEEVRKDFFIIIGSVAALIVLLGVIEYATSDDSAVDDSLSAIPDNAETPSSLGSFRLSDRVQSRLPRVKTEAETFDLSAPAIRDLSRIPAKMLAAVNNSPLAQSGWSLRPSMSQLRDTSETKFLFRVEREF